MKVNNNDINHLIWHGNVFTEGTSNLMVSNYMTMNLFNTINGADYVLYDNVHDFTKFNNKKIIIFYTFIHNMNKDKGTYNMTSTVTDPFKFTGHDTVQTCTGDGQIKVDYFNGSDLTINCATQSNISDKKYMVGIVLEVTDQ